MDFRASLAELFRAEAVSPLWRDHESPLRRSAVLVPFLWRQEGWELLFLKRAPMLSRHSGEVCFPGGMREPQDLTIVETALREMAEETSVPREKVHPFAVLSAEFTVVSGVEVYPVLGFVSDVLSMDDLVLDKGEVEGGVMVTLASFSMDPHMHTVLVDGRRVEYPEYPLENGWRIWGMTARILARILNLYRRGVL